MRKTFAALLPLTLLLIAAAPAVAGDFRAVDWGMSKAQVKAAENLEVMQEGASELIYGVTLFGERTGLVYYFADGRLVRAQYTNTARHGDKRRHLRYFDTLTERITRDHGVPIMDETAYASVEIRDNPEIWLSNPDAGDLDRYMYWDAGETHVFASLTGHGGESECTVEYSSMEFGYLIAESAAKGLRQMRVKVREMEALVRKRDAEAQGRGERARRSVDLLKDHLRIMTRMLRIKEQRVARQVLGAM